MRTLISRLYLFVPLAVLILCQVAWLGLASEGNARAGSPLLLKVAFPVLLLVGTFFHLRRR
jgi:hypothetical protein